MDETYIRIENSLELRKDMLRLALDSAKLLKSSAEAKNLREEKIRRIGEVSNKIKDIHLSVNSLKSKLPKVEKPVQEKKAIQKILPKTVIKVKHETTEMERLSSELRDIEEKIRKL